MAATGGSIESVTLKGRTFSVAFDADSQRKLGGFENDVQANGDGTSRLLKTRVPWSAADLTLSTDDLNGDQEFIQQLADGNDLFPIVATYASGAIFNGSGQITGELQASSANATTTVSLMGSGVFAIQP